MHGSQSHPDDSPLTAAEALKEEFIQLHGPLPAYHAWLKQLPAEPRLWLLRIDHFKNPRPFIAGLLAAATSLTRFLRDRLGAETSRTLEACQRSPHICDSFLESLAADLNRVIAGGQPLYDKERFASVKLTPETETLAKSAPAGQRLEILNRVLLEEAFPGAIATMWDTLAGVHALIHTRGRTALCLSGGGIRSATFGLGVLQGLAKRDLLGEFDYLSTVSGGGYIGSWLSSWIHHAGSSKKVFESLKNQSIASPTEPEPEPLEHLRRFSNYLTPRLGSLSADTWTLIGTYLRNLALNWIVFLPLILAVLAVPRLGVALLRLPAEPWALTTLMAGGVVLGAIGIAFGAVQRPTLAGLLRERSRFWAKRGDQMSFLLWCFGPLWLAAVCFTTFWAWLPGITFELPPWWCFAAAGAFLHLCGWLLSVVVLRRAGITEVAAVLLTGAVGGLMLWLPAREAFTNLLEAPDLELYVCFAVPVFLFVFLLTATLFIGLASKRTGDADREWWARMGAWLLLGIVGWSAFSSLALFGPLGLLALPLIWNLAGGLPGLFIVLAGYSNATPPGKEESAQVDWKSRLMNWGLALAAPLFIVFAIALLSLATTALLKLWPDLQNLAHLTLVHETPVWLAAALILGAGLFGLLMSRLISINKFSLHSVYRNRLIRAYLGASNPKRDPNPFTGFDPRDNLRLSQLEGQRPLHVVNLALNLVSDDNLAWQQRKAETFTASSLHVGNYRLGYRRARDYAQNEKREGLSLGTAITISGAAASPNQGYHSSPTIALLMTLFNVRLGAWLGNPGPAGHAVFHRSSPGNAALHVAKEAFGLTDNDSPYVYLSDGGHFENLGLYEMVLRRCHLIVVSDAGCDTDCCLEDLGNAIRKIRIDLGVPIDMTRFDIHSRKAGPAGRHCAIGEIHYDKVDGPQARRGLLIYIKPAITGDEPRDVFNYAQASPEFPHESTGDQWFSESQFESYRMLGLHTVTEMCQDWERTREYYSQVPPLAIFARQTCKCLEIPYPPGLEQRLCPGIGKDEPAAPVRAVTAETPATVAAAASEPSGGEPKSF
jgi:hypothetical protein